MCSGCKKWSKEGRPVNLETGLWAPMGSLMHVGRVIRLHRRATVPQTLSDGTASEGVMSYCLESLWWQGQERPVCLCHASIKAGHVEEGGWLGMCMSV